MKKKSMALGALLMAVAVTGYSVSGTYAKYTSSIDITDEARVAKWGFNATDKNGNLTTENTIDLFSQSYSINGTDNELKYVLSSNTDKVVAPGTKGSYEFQLEGEVETRYALLFAIDENKNTDIVVYYSLDAEGNIDRKSTTPFDGALEYRPIRYTVKYTRGDSEEDLTKGLLTNLDSKTLINALKGETEREYAAGEFNQKYVISWEWAPRNATNNATDKGALSKTNVDILDTFAGQEIVKAMNEEGNTFGQVKFDVKITANQVTANQADYNDDGESSKAVVK